MSSIKDKTIVVTGSTGMLGSDLVAHLLMAGCRKIKLPVRNSARIVCLEETLKRYGLESHLRSLSIIEMSLTNALEIGDLLSDVDVVFHCAAVVSFDPRRDDEIISSNVEITTQIAIGCRESNVELLVHVSSIATLGDSANSAAKDHDETDLIVEDSILSKLGNRSAYSKSKFYSENVVWREYFAGLNVVIINPSIILGEQNAELINLANRSCGFYTTGVKGYVDVRDVSRVMISLASCKEAVGQRFIISAANLSFRELFCLIAKSAGGVKPRFKIGKFLLNLVSAVDFLVSRCTKRPRYMSRSIVSNAVDRSFYSGEKLCRMTGFEYTPIAKTIERIVNNNIK